MNRRLLRILAVLFSFALIAAACGGDDTEDNPAPADDGAAEETPADDGDAEETPADDGDVEEGADDAGTEEEGTEEEGAGEEEGATGGDDIARLTEAAAEVFPCFEGDGGTPTDSAPENGVTADEVRLAYLDADLTTLIALNLSVDLGPSGDRYKAIMDDYNARCGGINGRQIVTDIYSYDAINGPVMDEVCTQVTQENPALISQTRVFPLSKDLCITEVNESMLMYETGRPQASIDRAGGRLFSVDLPEDKQAFLQTGMLAQAGQLDGATIGVIHSTADEQTDIANDGTVAGLAEQGIEPATVVALQQAGVTCEGYPSAVQQMVDAGVDTVFLVLSGACAPGFVGEAATQGYFPQYIAVNQSGLGGDVGTQGMVELGDAFDGALSHMTIAQQVTGFPEEFSPAPWDQACNDYLNGLIGTDFQFGEGPWSASVMVCSGAYATLAAIAAAGSDLTQESFQAAMETVDFVPLPRNQIGAYGAGQPWAAPPAMFTVEWRAECGCYNYVDGPTPVG